ncbi:MAG: C40 family peptidase [Bacteroidia bacterium]|nr:C40 family peptidase [Bacteroidia bacterium]MDW8157297.1 C40 family peptidase [Bacteroidia bacterium]
MRYTQVKGYWLLLFIIFFLHVHVSAKAVTADSISSEFSSITFKIWEGGSSEQDNLEEFSRISNLKSTRSSTFKVWEGDGYAVAEEAGNWEYWDMLSTSKNRSRGNFALIGSLDINSNTESFDLMKIQNVTYKLIQSIDILAESTGELSNLSSYYRINTKLQDFFLRNYNLELGPYDSQPLYEFIMRWHRTPYVWGGNSKYGVDCSGFVGILVDSLYQRKIPRVAGNIYQICQKIEKENLKEGDMVFFIRGNYIFHVGLYLKNNKFVHASSGLGVIVSDLNEPYWRRYYFAGGRLKD